MVFKAETPSSPRLNDREERAEEKSMHGISLPHPSQGNGANRVASNQEWTDEV